MPWLRKSGPPSALGANGPRDTSGPPPVSESEPFNGPSGERSFVVKLRSIETKSWGNQVEILAASAQAAAEQVAGETLVQGLNDRASLRARVWATPFGSQPEVLFYSDGSNPA